MRRGGFTLIELVVCVVVLGVAASVVGPAFRNDATTTVSTLAQQVRQLRRQALQRGQPIVVVLRVDSVRYDVTVLPDGRALWSVSALAGPEPYTPRW